MSQYDEFWEKNQTPMFKAKDLRDRNSLDCIPSNQPGWYRWWAPQKAVRKLLGDYYREIIKTLTKNNHDLYSIYVGIAANDSIRNRINWHINQEHSQPCVSSGYLSTFRQSISSLVGKDQGDEDATNSLIDELCVEIHPIKHQIKSQPASEALRSIEKRELLDHVLPLNIQNNQRKEIQSFKEYLKKKRSEAKKSYLSKTHMCTEKQAKSKSTNKKGKQTMEDRILALLRKQKAPLTVSDIVEKLSATRQQYINKCCNTLADKGFLDKSKSRPFKYQITGKPQKLKKPKKTESSFSKNNLSLSQLRNELNGTTVFIIPCCKSKKPGGLPYNDRNNPTSGVFQYLNDLNRTGLQTGRSNAANQANIAGIEFFANNPNPETLYQEAKERYIGQLYNANGVRDFLSSEKANNVLIMSALYGLLTCTDLIQDYNLEMTQAYENWQRSLPSVINNCVSGMKAKQVIGLFPKGNDNHPTYRHIFTSLRELPGPPAYCVTPINAGIATLNRLARALLYLNGRNIAAHEYHIERIR